MIGVYFSGTGNTRYCIEKFLAGCREPSLAIAMEKADAFLSEIEKHETIIFAYPIYFSNIPKIVRDFIEDNASLWKGKKMFIICTMALFSGDGSGVSARLLQRYGADILGGIHIRMPDNICDERVLKRTYEKNCLLIQNAQDRMIQCSEDFMNGRYEKNGLGFFSRTAGLLIQRLWTYNRPRKFYCKVHIHKDKCIRCRQCVNVCPLNNLVLSKREDTDGIKTKDSCTLCYRCANLCPQQAITLMGKKVYVQHDIHEYINDQKS